MTTLLALNPTSRNGDIDPCEIAARLRRSDSVVTCQLGRDRLHDVSDRIEDLSCIVLGGGDGTLHHALPTLLKLGVPVGVLPLGTANDFARSLGLPMDIESALDVIEGGHTRRVDIGRVNNKPFLNAVGLGLGPALTQELTADLKRRLGVFSYPVSLFRVMRESRGHRASLVMPGSTTRVRYMQLTIANGVHYGGGMMAAEDARLDDGVLKILCLTPQSLFDLAWNFISLRRGPRAGDTSQAVKLWRTEEVVVTTRRPLPVTADGEVIGDTPVTCTCTPGALKVFVPPQAGAFRDS